MTHNRAKPRATAPVPDERCARDWSVSLLIFGLTFAVYAQTIGFDFVDWDDPVNTYDNPYVSPPTWAGLAHLWSHPYEDLYVPLVYATFAWDAALWTGRAAGFHLTNVLLAALSAMAAHRLLRRLLQHRFASAIGALLFALHPVQVESVVWITGRKDVLCGLMVLLALVQYVRWSQTGSAGAYVLGTVAFVLALLAKPSAICVPFMALAYEAATSTPNWKRRCAWVAPWLVLAVVWTWGTIQIQSAEAGAGAMIPVWQRGLVAADAIVFYLGKIFVPTGLVAVYGRMPREVGSAGWSTVALGLVLSLGALVIWRGSRITRTGAAWFVLGILPVLGLVPFEFQGFSTVADRYLFLSMPGAALVGAGLIAYGTRAGASLILCRFCYVLATALLTICVGLNVCQQRVWRNTETLWMHNLVHVPDNPDANYNLGAFLSRTGRSRDAIDCYRRAIEHDADNFNANNNLANELLLRGRQLETHGQADRAREMYEEATERYQICLSANPADARIYFNAGTAFRLWGRPDSAEALFAESLKHPPPLAPAYIELGDISMRRGETASAIEYYQSALRIDPRDKRAAERLESARRMRSPAQRQ